MNCSETQNSALLEEIRKLDIAGIKIPDYMHCKSLLILLSNQTFKWRYYYYIESERRKTRTFHFILLTFLGLNNFSL